MIDSRTQNSRRELGEFIRAHRARLQPSMFGMEMGARRRTPGLRREELAQLAGVSATWFTWIEQGRDVSVSPSALSRLAKIMRLSPAERTYLFDLAGKRDPLMAETQFIDLPEGLEATVNAIATPAYLLDRAWNALAWNDAAAALFIGWLDGDCDRNLLRYVFLEPRAQALIEDWEARARRLAGEFRADYSRHPATPEIRLLIDDLRQKSLVFADAWEAHAVIDREGGERTFSHPEDGFQRYQQITFLLARHHDVKLVVLTRK